MTHGIPITMRALAEHGLAFTAYDYAIAKRAPLAPHMRAHFTEHFGFVQMLSARSMRARLADGARESARLYRARLDAAHHAAKAELARIIAMGYRGSVLNQASERVARISVARLNASI